jgi:hypothetical protein
VRHTGGYTDPEQAATAILTAVTGGATMLLAAGQISYLETALTEALGRLRPSRAG